MFYRIRKRRRTLFGADLSKNFVMSSVFELFGECDDVCKMYNVCDVYSQCTQCTQCTHCKYLVQCTHIYVHIWGCPIDCADWGKSPKTAFAVLYICTWLNCSHGGRLAFQLAGATARPLAQICSKSFLSSKKHTVYQNEQSTEGKVNWKRSLSKIMFWHLRSPSDDMAC